MKVSDLTVLLKKQFEINGKIVLKVNDQSADPELTLEQSGIYERVKVEILEPQPDDVPQPVLLKQPSHEVKEFFKKVAIALNKEPTSFDQISDELIAGGFETKD
jgi:hypothetical protein